MSCEVLLGPVESVFLVVEDESVEAFDAPRPPRLLLKAPRPRCVDDRRREWYESVEGCRYAGKRKREGWERAATGFVLMERRRKYHTLTLELPRLCRPWVSSPPFFIVSGYYMS